MAKPEIKFSFPISTILFTVFLILKLAGVITWSWWCVTAPLWVPLVLIFGVMAVVLFLGLVVAVLESR